MLLVSSLTNVFGKILRQNALFSIDHREFLDTASLLNVSMFVLNTVSHKRERNDNENPLLFSSVKHSKCRSDFLNRVKLNEQLKQAAKVSGKQVPLSSIKRQVRKTKIFETI
jgi:hypothetical protein